MLQQLDIQNIALIDKVNIELGNGLNILSGETGAGKSIIIDSIHAILGERLSKDLIRTGKEKAVVEAVFQVKNDKLSDLFEKMGMDPEEDGTLIISREFSLSGKNICRVNGKMVTVSVLKEIGERIIDIHGQFDNQSLLRTESHIELLDSFGGEGIQKLRQEYSKLLLEYRETKNRLKEYSGDRIERERKIDLLKYQADEIKKAKLKPGEEETLEKQRMLLANSEKIIGTLSSAYELIYSGSRGRSSTADSINEAISNLNSIARLDDKYDRLSARLQDLSYQLDDIIEEIRRERDDIEFDPGLLEQIDERIDLIYRLKRKYGNSVEEILSYCRNIENDLNEISNSEEIVQKLQEKLEKLNNKLYETAVKISEERHMASQLLESEIGNELEDLEMKKARFKVSTEFDDRLEPDGSRKYLPNGLDRVEFLISPNAGEPLKPLSKIASGGEMSRIMLAIKTILADVDEIPTLIFDEIDIGISGKASQKVGEKLSYISKNHQVICVTHLAQIACMADSHFLIKKISDESSTMTVVEKLSGPSVKDEIARILGGANISNTTVKLADEMLKSARNFKKS